MATLLSPQAPPAGSPRNDGPEHAHLHSLRTRLLLPLLVVFAGVCGAAVVGGVLLSQAAGRDAEASAALLAHEAVAALPDDGGVGALAARLPEGSVVLSLDRRGTVLSAAPDEAMVGQSLDEPLLSDVVAGKDGAVTLAGGSGLRRAYGFARTAAPDGTPRYVVVGILAATMTAAQDQALVGATVVGLGLALLALWLALALGDLLLLRRVHRFVMVMKDVVSGDLAAKATLAHGLGELDELTDVFGELTGKLEQSIAQTETKVKKRTVELEFNKGMAELDKARTEALLTAVGDGLFATDETSKIIFVNQECERMLGFTAAELVGSVSHEFLRLEDDKRVLVPIAERPTMVAITTGAKYQSPVYPKPYYFVRKDATRFPVQITVTPIVAAGKVAGSILVFRDITDEIEFDRRKSEFISIASHQLRSPLSATKWLADMLRKGDAGKLQPPQQELAEKLFIANERMVTLVNELLNISRLESGTVKIDPRPADLPALVETVLAEFAPLLQARKQTLDKSLVPVPPMVIDATLIREVVANLVSNACKYSPEGSVLSVGVSMEGTDAVVSVRDRGIGIPLSEQPQMFRKFFRAENATRSIITGTGLGLYVCKAIVELHGGRIWFESVQDQGTTFRFSLPLAGAPIKAGEVHLT